MTLYSKVIKLYKSENFSKELELGNIDEIRDWGSSKSI